ncbi:hypothetical protein [Haloarcula amylolytica]|uniref:Uncharacterized protein n=1 Tax=Haloarcula amylolytica JCM 13557 TaxID=1227452 RepID=M0K3G8_9EURY|nr:hypothetical protein [Haloarcula amylolytica]EMA14664.1 hypothetical protein C442_19891 [Haloarcula amylolytica JCM 13557]
MSQPHLSPEQQPSDQRQIPSIETIGPVVDEVIDIARQELDAPRSVKIKTWEDREFLVRVKHGSAPGVNTRYGYETAIQYHSDRETVEAFLIEEDTHTDEAERLLKMELGTIPDPVPEKIGE